VPDNLDVPAVSRRSGVGYEYAVERQVLQNNSEAVSQCISQQCCGMRHRRKSFPPHLASKSGQTQAHDHSAACQPSRSSVRMLHAGNRCRVVQGLTRVWRQDAGGFPALPADKLRVPQRAGRDQHLIAVMDLELWLQTSNILLDDHLQLTRTVPAGAPPVSRC
jgi:hypothetical protein